ncbi:hypothetical protein [Rhodoplanes sp. Z2-YC6860]|uniref:hypothetical protein n=1 Tax=Rhodoplanes sp. Z2-YC6860 TaxID=674703 RepID=UPI0008309030|nr:hypothetical protein [Rhodoplanes sp. Z2-YC6860]
MRIRIILLACLLFIVTAPAVRADTAIGTKWRPIALDQGNCMSYARMAIFRLGFYKSDPGSQTMSGKKGEYTASIRCISDNQLVFFIIAGPSPDVVANYLNILYSQFGVM